jgi:hypothetical protein
LSIGVISKMPNRATFPEVFLCLKEGEQDTDARFLCSKVLHHLYLPLHLFETTPYEVSGSYVFPSACYMTHAGQTVIAIFLQAFHESRKDGSALVGKTLSMCPGFHEIRRVIDPIESCFDERPFTLGTNITTTAVFLSLKTHKDKNASQP